MAGVAVILPWQDSGCEHRRRALDFTRTYWTEHHPDWEVVVGTQPAGEKWSKGLAVSAGLAVTNAELLVIADADSLVTNAAEAIRRLETGAPWVVPHQLARYLKESATTHIYATGILQPGPTRRTPYQSCEGGGIVVIRREDYIRCGGFDPRFSGYEDNIFAWVAYLLLGQPIRLNAALYHMFHPPVNPTGRVAADGLIGRYKAARKIGRSAVEELIAPNVTALREVAGATDGTHPPSTDPAPQA